MAIDSILVAVDWSDTMAPVVAAADRLGILHDARVHLVHVIPVNTDLVVSDQSMPNLLEPFPYENEAEAEKALLNVKQSMHHNPDRIVLHLIQGSPAQEILRQQQAVGSDIVVLGSHGHGAMYNLLVGSASEAVLHRCPVPVMVVPAPES